MKAFKILTAIGIVLMSITSCTDDNYDIYSESADDHTPTIIDVENSISFRLASSDETYTEGVAYKNGVAYHVGSKDVIVECTEGGGLAYSFFEGDFFTFLFVKNPTSNFVLTGGFTTEIDGEEVSVSSDLIPGLCSDEPIEIEITEESDRLKGNISGEFYILADEIVSPFDSCVNFVSVGILEASFDVELIECE